MKRVEITESALLIRISRLFNERMSERALYEATRGVWNIGDRRDAVRLALAVVGGVVHAYADGDRASIDVRDHCGGLPSGFSEKMFKPFAQGSFDRSGLGLGLSIARRTVETEGGSLTVRDVPGTGCIFTISLPRHSL